MSSAAEEIGCCVRRRCRKACHPLPRERRANQRYVAGGAAGIGRGEVSRLDPMASKAAFDDRLTYCHSRLTDPGMATGARRRVVLGSGGVLEMIESQVRAPRQRGWPPYNKLLDRPVVAGGARRRIGPERLPFLGSARVTRGAQRKERLVLRMVEAFRRLLQRQEQDSRRADHRWARPPGTRPMAGGRCSRLSPLPNENTARSVTRHWPQSIAAGSGRRRSSAYRTAPSSTRTPG